MVSYHVDLVKSFHSSSGEAFRKAIAPLLNKIDRHSDTPRNLYNLACGFALARDKNAMLWALKIAIKYDPKYRRIAQEDEDFREYWKDSEFHALVA